MRLVSYFWLVRGYTMEGRQRLAEILALPGAEVPTRKRAWHLFRAGELAHQQGDFAAAEAFLQASRSIYQDLGNMPEALECCCVLALLAQDQGDYTRARSLYDQALAAARDLGHEVDIANALSWMGYTAYLDGDIEAAQPLLEEGLRILRKGQEVAWAAVKAADSPDYGLIVNHLGALAWACEHWGEVADARGDYAAAHAHLEESVAIFREFGFLRYAASGLHKLGRVARHQGLWSAAATHYCESLAFWRQDGDGQGIAACLEGLGAVAASRGEAERAARLLGAAAVLRESRDLRLPPVERADLERVMSGVRACLGEQAFAAAWAAGHGLRLDEAIAEGLQEASAG